MIGVLLVSSPTLDQSLGPGGGVMKILGDDGCSHSEDCESSFPGVG